MSKTLKILGLIFLVIIIVIVIFAIVLMIWKPYGINILKIPSALWGDSSSSQINYDHPLLSQEQEKFLETIGVDTTQIPTQLTEEQASCLETQLGETRAKQLLDGATPTTSDYLKAKSCF